MPSSSCPRTKPINTMTLGLVLGLPVHAAWVLTLCQQAPVWTPPPRSGFCAGQTSDANPSLPFWDPHPALCHGGSVPTRYTYDAHTVQPSDFQNELYRKERAENEGKKRKLSFQLKNRETSNLQKKTASHWLNLLPCFHPKSQGNMTTKETQKT